MITFFVLEDDSTFIVMEDDSTFIVTEDSTGGGGGEFDSVGTASATSSAVGQGQSNRQISAVGTAAATSSVSGTGQRQISIVGSGGATLGIVSVINYVQSPTNTLAVFCANRSVPFVQCRKAYIPNITRCNQKIIQQQINALNSGGDN